MEKFSDTLYVNSENSITLDSDDIKHSFSFLSYASFEKNQKRTLKKKVGSAFISSLIIPNKIVSFENWKGYVSFVAENYFEVIVKSLDFESNSRKFRIKKTYIQEETDIKIEQIVLVKVKRYRRSNEPEIRTSIEVILDKPLNRSDDEVKEIVNVKMKRFAYMFDEDEKR